MTELINNDWLIHDITVSKKIGEDDYQNPIYDDPVSLSNTRVDLTKNYVGKGNERQITANATVFLFADFTDGYFVFDDSWLQSKVVFKGHDYILTSFDNYSDVEKDEPFSTELQVI